MRFVSEEFVGVRMPTELRDALAELARARGQSLSAAMRRLLADAVGREVGLADRRR